MAEGRESGKLVFNRRGTWQDFFRAYDIFVDGVLQGRLKRSDELTVDVLAGLHSCQARIAKTGSAATDISVAAGETTRVHITHGVEGSLMERAVSYDEYLLLEVEP